MALVWLRVYPTYEVLGWLFGLEKSNAWENVQDVLAVLETLADFPFERPAADRRQARDDGGGDGRVPRGEGDHRRQGTAVPPAAGLGAAEAVLLGEEEAAHGQEPGRLHARGADRGGQRRRCRARPTT